MTIFYGSRYHDNKLPTFTGNVIVLATLLAAFVWVRRVYVLVVHNYINPFYASLLAARPDEIIILGVIILSLPAVDTYMLLEYMKNSDKHNVAEIRGAKALSSTRDSYVENSIGYVEISRTGNLCIVRAKVVPEHKLSNKYYVVMVHIDELEETITDVSCDGCAAAAGGCKHTIVVLRWLEKRSDEPAPTSVQCYWTKPSLKRALDEPLLCKDLNKGKVVKRGPKDGMVLEKLRTETKAHACGKSLLMLHDPTNQVEKITNYCVFDLLVEFLLRQNNQSYDSFRLFSDDAVKNKKDQINKQTLGQVNSKLWYCMRQGRITGSKIYEIAHCKTPHGSLVEELLGGYKVPETKAMKRGKTLEASVLLKLQSHLNKKIEASGFILVNSIFGASPDGIGDDFVVEIKCPTSQKTKSNYIKDGQICNKYKGQIQLEMLAAGKKKCIFCVADPKFETNGKIEKYNIDFDEDYIEGLMTAAEQFWKLNVFPLILKSAMT